LDDRRLAEEETAILGMDETTPWLKFTKWLKLFEGKDLEVKPCFTHL
jgi:hypothetical protein